VYNLRNAVYLRPNITLRGSSEKTILKKTGSVVTALVRDSDWFEYGIRVDDTKGFVPAGGTMLRAKTGPGDWQFDVLRATVTAIEGNVIFLDRITEENFWLEKNHRHYRSTHKIRKYGRHESKYSHSYRPGG